MKIAITLLQFNALLFVVRKIPPKTPNRWESISAYVKEAVQSQTADSNKLVLTIGEGRKIANFSATRDMCKTAWDIISKDHPYVSNIDFDQLLHCKHCSHDIKPIILLPPYTSCIECGSNIGIRNRPTFPVVYTEVGPYVGALYSGQCVGKTCHMTYFYSYRQNHKSETFFYDPNEDKRQFFHITSSTVFSLNYLKDVTYNIVFSAVSFHSRAQVYNAQHAEKITTCISHDTVASHRMTAYLNDERIEEVWIIWSLVKFYNRYHLLNSNNLHCDIGKTSHRKNIESKCKEACNLISTRPNEWIMHVCDVPGCKEGYITVDGNEKLKRPMCAAPHLKQNLRKDLPQIVTCCPNTPLLGNLYSKPNIYCNDHIRLTKSNIRQQDNQTTTECDRQSESQPNNDTDCSSESSGDKEHAPCSSTTQPQEDRYSITPSLAKGLPTSDSGQDTSTLVGCKKKKNISKFYNTTAGILALIRPCGIVVSISELYTCESCTQVLLFLLRTFCKPSQDVSYFKRLRFLGYDRACDLHPYLINQALKGSAGAKLLVENVQFLVDKFHCNKHTEPCCMPLSNPNCKYNPELPRFSDIHNANTESCEQGFFRLNKYKHMTKHMTQYKRMFFFNEINNHFNQLREEELIKRGQLNIDNCTSQKT